MDHFHLNTNCLAHLYLDKRILLTADCHNCALMPHLLVCSSWVQLIMYIIQRSDRRYTSHYIYVLLSHNHDFYKHSKQNKYIFLVSSQSFLVSNINQGGQLDFESTRNQGDWDREGLSYSKSPRSSSARYRRLKF